MFFVNVASKGLSRDVSLLFATLAGRSISVAAKGLRAMVRRDPDRLETFGPDRVGISALQGETKLR